MAQLVIRADLLHDRSSDHMTSTMEIGQFPVLPVFACTTRGDNAPIASSTIMAAAIATILATR